MGTAFLLAIVVGSGIMGERLAGGNVAIALLANALATGAGLIALILTFGPISAHINPAVTLLAAASGELSWREAPMYIAAQVTGAFLGVFAAHAMFGMDILQLSTRTRSGAAQAFSELVATFGLLIVVASVAKHRRADVAYAVGAYITAAYWFTASTSFANPAVTLARAATESFAGIRPADAPLFIAAQLVAVVVAAIVVPRLFAKSHPAAR